MAALLLPLLGMACGQGANQILIPTVYLVGGKVADPTSNPITPLAGARVWVETAPEVSDVTSDANGVFLLHGVPPGVHRLRAELPGRRSMSTIGIPIDENVVDAILPLFTDAEIDSILSAQGAPAWDRQTALFGLFARKANGLPLAGAGLLFHPREPNAGGTLVQTAAAEDPMVVVNAVPGDYSLSVSKAGFVWDGPYSVTLVPGLVTFGAPRARPNVTGFVFADRASGNAVEGAQVAVLTGTTPANATTDFLGQFVLTGLIHGRYLFRFTQTGFLPSVSWPQELDTDTTLVQAILHADTLAAWSAAGGGPAIASDRGHLAVEARNATGGERILGATLSVNPQGTGFAIPETDTTPALLLDLAPGTYTVTLSAPSVPGGFVTTGVTVRAGEVTYSRLNL